MAIAIKVENLSKAYQLGEFSTGTISRDIERWWYKVLGKEDPFLKIDEVIQYSQQNKAGKIWALNDINFEVEKGNAIGIIGRNGAGKSTLLKILSRITLPTKGGVKIKGKIASLLEVGTGFHPELTGRENIYLNGAILGMRKEEIKKRFEEIVDFSGIDQFINTPVKRYSSGMYVRLAFAVAAHLDSEILIVDEVLAVGDAEFQKKCVGKMGDVTSKEGRTILFVSHNLSAVQKLCNRGVLLDHGRLISMGPMKMVIDNYLSNDLAARNEREFENDPTKVASVIKIELKDENSNLTAEVPIGKNWVACVYFKINNRVDNFVSAIGIINSYGLPINTSWQEPHSLEPGIYCAEFKQNEIMYTIGRYQIVIGLSFKGIHNIQYIEDAIELFVIPVTNGSDEKEKIYNPNTGIILNQLKMRTYKIS